MELHYDAWDAAFEDFVEPATGLVRLHGGMTWAEGPVYRRDEDTVVFSDVPADTMYEWHPGLGVRVFRSPSRFANGNTVDAQGRLVTCQQGTRSLTRTDRDGRVSSLVDRYGADRLNSPNDVVVRSDGTMWFTDPDYGILSDHEGHEAESELDGCFVFCFDPSSGELRIVADGMDKPNGLAFSTDERVLYVADSGVTHDPSGPHHILAYDLRGGDLEGRRVFAPITPGWPDGLCVDDQDNVWTSAGDGVHCISADGTPLGRIRIGETVSNCTFGGSEGNRLFITASSSLYAVSLRRRGAGCRSRS